MGCENCKLHRGEFASEAVYVSFSARLWAAADAGCLLGSRSPVYSGTSFEWRFQCSQCLARWRLLEPDHAFR